jgi:hypothetical protein
VQTITAERARNYGEGGSLDSELGEWLDEAQAKAFTGELPKTYLVIEITK